MSSSGCRWSWELHSHESQFPKRCGRIFLHDTRDSEKQHLPRACDKTCNLWDLRENRERVTEDLAKSAPKVMRRTSRKERQRALVRPLQNEFVPRTAVATCKPPMKKSICTKLARAV